MPAWLNQSAGGQLSSLEAALPHDMKNGLSAGDQIVSDYAAVASPPYGFRTHDRGAPFAPRIEETLEARVKLRRKSIVGVIVEALVGPEAVDVLRRASHLCAKAAQRGHVFVGNANGRQGIWKRVFVELRIGSRLGNCSDIRDKLNLSSLQQFDELPEASVGMADGEERKPHTSSSRVVKRATLVGCDVVGLVAFDLVLRIIFSRRGAHDPCSRSRGCGPR